RMGVAREMKQRGGTTMYRAPEKATNRSPWCYDPFKADAYSFGVTILECLIGYSRLRKKYDQGMTMAAVLDQYVQRLDPKERSFARFASRIEAIRGLVLPERDRLFVYQAMDAFAEQ